MTTNSETCETCEQIHLEGLKSQQPKLSRSGKIVLGVGAAVAAVIYGVTVPFILPGFRRICLPYVPATDSQISNVISCLRQRSGTLIDLGSGDGRILHKVMMQNRKREAGMNLTKAVGIELNTWLVCYSRIQAWRYGLASCTKYYKKNIFHTDLKSYDNIVVFGVESLMKELEPKLLNEMKDNGILVACRFPLPNWSPLFTEGEGLDTVWVYEKPKHLADSQV